MFAHRVSARCMPQRAMFDLAGFSISVPNGHPAVKARADHVTETAGGEGVARELAELVLRARGTWPY